MERKLCRNRVFQAESDQRSNREEYVFIGFGILNRIHRSRKQIASHELWLERKHDLPSEMATLQLQNRLSAHLKWPMTVF